MVTTWIGHISHRKYLLKHFIERRIEGTGRRGKRSTQLLEDLKGAIQWKRKYLLKHFIEGRIEGTGRRGKRSKQLLKELKGAKRQWKLKEEALDRTVWRIGFG